MTDASESIDLQEGLRQSAAGETVSLGSFAKYADDIDLAELERLAREATPGPWTTTQSNDTEATTWLEHPLGDVLNHDERGHGHMQENFSWMRRADAEFVAAANPQTTLALVARVREAEARIEKALVLVGGIYEEDGHNVEDIAHDVREALSVSTEVEEA